MDSVLAKLDVRGFPNPARDLFFLELSGPVDQAEVKVYDGKGQQLLYASMTSNRYQLDVSMYPSGLYHVCIIHGQEMLVVDLMKE